MDMPSACRSCVIHGDVHRSSGFFVQGHSTRRDHISIKVLRTSHMALCLPGPAEATIILSLNWARAMRPAVVRHVGYPSRLVDKVPRCRARVLARLNFQIQYKSAD